MFSQCWDRLQAYGKLGIN